MLALRQPPPYGSASLRRRSFQEHREPGQEGLPREAASGAEGDALSAPSGAEKTPITIERSQYYALNTGWTPKQGAQLKLEFQPRTGVETWR